MQDSNIRFTIFDLTTWLTTKKKIWKLTTKISMHKHHTLQVPKLVNKHFLKMEITWSKLPFRENL